MTRFSRCVVDSRQPVIILKERRDSAVRLPVQTHQEGLNQGWQMYNNATGLLAFLLSDPLLMRTLVST